MEPSRTSAEVTQNLVEPEVLNFDNLTQKYILEMGQSHPEIKQAIEMWQNGHITWEQVTYMMIVTLLRSKSNISETYMKLLERMSPAPITISNDVCEKLGIKPIKMPQDSELFQEAVDFCD